MTRRHGNQQASDFAAFLMVGAAGQVVSVRQKPRPPAACFTFGRARPAPFCTVT